MEAEGSCQAEAADRRAHLAAAEGTPQEGAGGGTIPAVEEGTPQAGAEDAPLRGRDPWEGAARQGIHREGHEEAEDPPGRSSPAVEEGRGGRLLLRHRRSVHEADLRRTGGTFHPLLRGVRLPWGLEEVRQVRP